MIIISYGLPKSASTITFTYTEELLAASGLKSGQEKFKSFFNEGFIYRFGILNTCMLLFIHAFYGSIVVKTHSSPNFFIRLLIRIKLSRATCNGRDPRDIIISAIDHGKKEGDNPFKKFTSVQNTLPVILAECRKWELWKDFQNALFIRYEEITSSPFTALKTISDYLNLHIQSKTISAIVNKYESNKEKNKNFNKGTVKNRYTEEMSPEEISFCNASLEKYIHQLGYQL